MYIAHNSQYHSKSKHINYHFVREKVLDSTIELHYCPTSEVLADIRTKGFVYNMFSQFRSKKRLPASEKECWKLITIVRLVTSLYLYMISIYSGYYV